MLKQVSVGPVALVTRVATFVSQGLALAASGNCTISTGMDSMNGAANMSVSPHAEHT
jgi:hypothetical protein